MKFALRLILLATTLSLVAPSATAAVNEVAKSPELSVDNNSFTLSLQGSLGLAQGEAREVVYDYDEVGRRVKVSELIWDIENVVMLGGTLSAKIGQRYKLEGTFRMAVTEGEGQMENFDWLSEGSDWTDFSLSDVEVKDTYSFDLRASAEFYRRQSVGLSAVLGYRQDHWGWEDQLLRWIYSTDGFRDDIGEGDGSTSITYEQTFFIPYAGLALTLQNGPFSGEVFFHYSPFVTAEDDDLHLLRETRFQVEADGGDYYGFGLRGTYAITPRWSVGVAAEWQIIEELIGDTTLTDPDGTIVVEDSGGISSDWALFSVSLGYRF
jgi:outer membrane protease